VSLVPRGSTCSMRLLTVADPNKANLFIIYGEVQYGSAGLLGFALCKTWYWARLFRQLRTNLWASFGHMILIFRGKISPSLF
jgi:hypothetical protein